MRGLKGLKKQRRIQVIAVAAIALTLSTVLIGYAMRDGINFFRSPTQVVEDPPGAREVFRIGGLVEEGPARAPIPASCRISSASAKAWLVRGACKMASLPRPRFLPATMKRTCPPK